MSEPRDAVADLREIAFRLERAGEATYRVRAFRSAADALAGVPTDELVRRAAEGTLTQLPGVGATTARCATESLRGEEPDYLRRLPAVPPADELDGPAAALRAALRGDCHSHTDASDGGAPLAEMARAAARLGHDYLVITDHSPRLTVANGLSPARLRAQLDAIAALNATLPAGLRVLTGIEVDILADGSLDQEPELLDRLDVVVGSVHSALRDDRAVMTRRMVAAVTNPRLDILGHCTGRRLAGAGDRTHRGTARPESRFDAEAVFGACAEHGKAVEINCRPDRLDPPMRLLRQAAGAGCLFSIDTDAHAPGQLDWLPNGCRRAALAGVEATRVVNSWPVDRLLDWTRGHQS